MFSCIKIYSMLPRQQFPIPYTLLFSLLCFGMSLSLKAQCPISYANPNQGTINLVLGNNCTVTFEADSRIAMSGNCSLRYFRDGNMTIPFTDQPLFDGSNLGQTIDVFVTAEDGNPATPMLTPLRFIVKIVDTGKPTVTCPADLTLMAANTDCSRAITNSLIATTSDNCGGSVSLAWTSTGATSLSGTNSLAGRSFNIGRSVVTYTATDASANQNTCIFNIDVSEAIPPALAMCPNNITLDAPTGTCNRIVVSGLMPTYTDNCTLGANITLQYELSGVTNRTGTGSANNSVFNVGTTLVNYTAVDAYANTNNACSFSVTIKDIDKPSIICPADLTLTTKSDSCHINLTTTQATPVAFDNCSGGALIRTFAMNGVLTVAQQPLQQIVNQKLTKGNTTVTYYMADAYGNTNTCIQVIQVIDRTRPTITCNSSHIAQVTPVNMCNTPVTLPQPTMSDNCNSAINIALSYSISGATIATGNGTISASQQFVPGLTTVTYRATDTEGNFAECSYNVTVIEAPAVKPVLVCRADTTVFSASGKCNALINNGLSPKSATDNCTATNALRLSVALSGATIMSDSTVATNKGANGFTFNLGKTTVRYVLFDASGNSDTCRFDVYVLDNQRPVIACVADTIATTLDGCSRKIGGLQPSATDNCEVNNLIFSYELSGATPQPAVGTTIDAVDFRVGITSVKFIVRDAANNIDTCRVKVTILETIAPTISCPTNLTINSSDSTCMSLSLNIPNPVLSDNCNNLTDLSWAYTTSGATTMMGSNSINGKILNYGTTLITYRVQDFSGNTAQCSFSVRVKDATNPTIQCPPNQSIITRDTTCYAQVSSPAIAFADNCSATLSYTISGATQKTGTGIFSNLQLNAGNNTITYRATDIDGNNATCSFEIMVRDTIKPHITCPSNITLQSSGTSCEVAAPALNPIYTDNCAQIELSYSASGATIIPSTAGILNGKNFTFGNTTLTYRVTDKMENTATCSLIISVLDNIKPTAKCRPTMTIALDNTGNSLLPAVSLDNNSSDNCSAAVDLRFSSSQERFTCANIGQNNVVLTVSDVTGNIATCNSVVTVVNSFGNLQLQATATAQQETYWGASDGTVKAAVNGGLGDYEYLWSNGAITASQQNLPIGIYNVTVTDRISRCAGTIQVQLNSGPKLAFKLGNIIDTSNQTILLPLRVQNFNKVKSFRLSIKLSNPNIGTIQGLTNFAVNYLDSASLSFNQNSVVFSKKITEPQGITLTNGTALFMIRVKLNAPVGTFSSIDFHNIPFETQVEQYLPAGIVNIPLNLQKGSLGISAGGSVASISGKITREDGMVLPNVKVSLSGIYADSIMTQNEGKFNKELPMGAHTSLRPSRQDEVRTGLTAIDAVMVQRHILGYELFDSDYKKVAADVNNSGTITAIDVAMIKRVILGYQSQFDGNRVWRFVPKNYVFPQMMHTQVSNAPDTLMVDYLLENTPNQDFVAMKMGDINNSSAINFQGNAGPRGLQYWQMQSENRSVTAGEFFELTIKNKTAANLVALQTMLRFDTESVDFQSISSSDLASFDINDYNLNHCEQGKLSFVWTAPEGQSVASDATILKVHFHAKRAINALSEVFNFDESQMQNIVLDGRQEKALQWHWTASEQQEITSNMIFPNPASTDLFVKLVQPSEVKLTDMQGRVVLSQNTMSGQETLKFDVSALPKACYILKINDGAQEIIQKVMVH